MRYLTPLPTSNSISSLIESLDAAASALNLNLLLRLHVLRLRNVGEGTRSFVEVRGALVLLLVATPLLLLTVTLLRVEVPWLELQSQFPST